jgi:ABC transporter with metal-binding/Fe-S-binding domain ATP-binding protein
VNVASLFSGGKDSVFSIYIVKQWGWNIKYLVTVFPKSNDSWMFHNINLDQTEKIAKSLEIPLLKRISQGNKEEELDDLRKILKNLDIDGVISGAIASEYQRTRIEKICHELNIKSFTPLWHKNQDYILRDQLNSGFKIMIVGVFALGLNKNWLGRIIDVSSYEELKNSAIKHNINIAGEGGEYETIVLDGPIFNKKLVIDDYFIKWKRDNGVLQILKSHLD